MVSAKTYSEMYGQAVVCTLLLAGGVISQDTCTVTLEAENGKGGDVRQRSNASGELTVRLFQREELAHDDLVFHSSNSNTCYLQLKSIFYTNDGPRDEIRVFLNNTLLADVTTYAESKSGNNWNIIRTVNTLSSLKVRMTDGHYTIRLLVVEADENGVEIDKCLLQLECSHVIADGKECPSNDIIEQNSNDSTDETGTDKGDDEEDNEDDKTPPGGIIGIAAAVVTIVGGVTGVICAAVKCKRKSSSENVMT